MQKCILFQLTFRTTAKRSFLLSRFSEWPLIDNVPNWCRQCAWLSLSLHLPDKSLIAMRSLHRRALPARKTMFDVWEFRSFEAFNFVCSFTCLIRLRRRTPETEWEAELHNYLRRLARPELGLLFVPRPLKLLDGAEFSRQYILLTDSWHLMYGSVSFGSGHLAMPSTFNLVQVT